MKHYILISIISILSLTSIISNSIKLSTASDLPRERESITNEVKKVYTIKDYNGRIALFENEEKNPKVVYDIFTSSLPSGDKEIMLKGITVDSEAEVQKLIEEYTS